VVGELLQVCSWTFNECLEITPQLVWMSVRAAEIEGISVYISFNNPTPISMFDHRFKSLPPFHDQLIHRGKENHVYGSLFTYTDTSMHLLIILHTTLTNLVLLPTTEHLSIKQILEPWLLWVKQQSYNQMEQ
jgi:hypothetical protein